VPRAAVEKYGADFRSHPVGTGPFTLKEWVPGQRLELARNPNYWRTDRPFVDAVRLKVGLTQETQMRLFENANLDVLPDIPSADYPRLKQDPKWGKLIDEAPVLTTWYLGMNTEMAPFKDKRVRLAVNYAVDRDHLVQLRNGRAVKATSILPPKLPGFDPTRKGWPHDPEKARALLKEAGHPTGFATTLWIISSDQNLKLAEGIQADLKEVGIQASLKPATLQSFLQATKTRNTTAFFHNGWFPDYPDPSSFLEPLFHSRQIAPVNSNNSTFYSNPKVDKLLDEGAVLQPGPERWKKYQEAERLILEDAPWAPLYYEVETRIHQPNVHGVTIHPLWKYLLVDEIWKG
jgi:ABC-type transport system substrate-binding protein